MVSTLTDYGRFAGMLLNGGNIDGRRIMSAESVRQMHTVHTPLEVLPGREHWGLGVRVITGDGDPYLPVGVYGWSGAYGTHFWIDPVNRLYAILMKNSTYDGGSGNESARKLEEAVYTALT
jgi:CubicO group peptidase (beta-lactamase class C family)